MTLVFQGPVIDGPQGTATCIRRTRQALPRSRCVLSTWTGSKVTGLPVDRVVFSDDPGPLPGIKSRDGAGQHNNVNRQILSARQGLQDIETAYVVKIRTDCALKHAALLEAVRRYWEVGVEQRILTSSLFTIDPLMFEQMPYHVSDWFQFGSTRTLQQYWSVPFMSDADARFYEQQPHAGHSTFMDRRFRSRLAVEQHLATHYARRLGYAVPQYHNDIAHNVMDGHRLFLARHCIILDPWDLGLEFPKYEWAYRSGFQRLNCLLFLDWYELYRGAGGSRVEPSCAPLLAKRRKQKHVARLLGRWLDKAGPLLLHPGLKTIANRLLAVLAW
ncbi:MAG: hypothetical protein A4E19_06670 [Nitrospira sp. SG-bin1]|nr:MAG: hypothetical protein A4E19_06670 [Nitrospira sp. SG-bin1]